MHMELSTTKRSLEGQGPKLCKCWYNCIEDSCPWRPQKGIKSVIALEIVPRERKWPSSFGVSFHIGFFGLNLPCYALLVMFSISFAQFFLTTILIFLSNSFPGKKWVYSLEKEWKNANSQPRNPKARSSSVLENYSRNICTNHGLVFHQIIWLNFFPL